MPLYSFLPVALQTRTPDLGDVIARAMQIRGAQLNEEQARQRQEQENAVAQLLAAQGPALISGSPQDRQSVLSQLLSLGAPGAQIAAPFVSSQLQNEAQREAPLSPAEARALGLPPGAVATRTAAGGIRVVYTPPEHGPETFSSDPIEVQVDGERRLALIGNRGTIRYLPPNVSIQTLKTGLQPVPIYDAQGNLTVAFPDGRGGLVPARLPEGHVVAPRTRDIRTETDYIIVDQAGRPVGTIPRRVAEGQIEKAVGEAEGKRLTKAESALDDANMILSLIDQVLNHPRLHTATGPLGVVLSRIPGTDAIAIQSMLDQIRGQVFLQAFDRLRGSGQISNIEGVKAEQARARLDSRMDIKDFREALQELRDITVQARERALRDLAALEERRRAIGIAPPERRDERNGNGRTSNAPAESGASAPLRGPVYRFINGRLVPVEQ